MSEQLLNAVITVKEVGLETKRLKVIDTSGKVYSIWRTKRDGTETKAYQFFSPIALSAQGKSFEIGYDEKPNPQNQGTFFRAIKVIKPADELAVAKQENSDKRNPQLDAIVNRIIKLENAVFGEVKPASSMITPEHPDFVDVDNLPF